MNKKEAAKYLGCSERAVERYVQQGKISCRYEKGKTRSISVFDLEELQRFKGEGEAVRPAVETRQTTTIDQSGLAIFHDEPVDIVGVDGASDVVEVGDIGKLSAMVELLLHNQQLKPSEKLVLTIDDCRQLTGFSREILRDAIANGLLKARIIGKSWRVKRADLETYINEVL
ncbi:hypothetical protein NIES4074_61300 (plasmid) [Cylindrospermum sp. NIES-4074]|nr:hypothetical protein NIES4074_61300 [Cylindrospermum sp. NIES-4074]